MRVRMDGENFVVGLSVPGLLETVQKLFPEYDFPAYKRVSLQLPEPKVRHLAGSDHASSPDAETFGLSVSMIVKNEAKHLARCLDSVRDVADEIVIVDTGSTDDTVEIARQYTKQVYFHPWEDDFSKARNQALGYCTKDWVLSIDADEELVPADVPLLRRVLNAADQKPDVNAIMLDIVSVMKGGGLSLSRFPRLFRRRVARWKGIVHNQLVTPKRWEASAVRLFHHGYNLPEEELAAKRQRTLQLLRKQIEAKPENITAWMHLLHTWRIGERWEDILANADRILDSERATFLNRQMASMDVIASLVSLGRKEEVEAVALKALEEYPENLDIIMALGLVYRDLGQTEKAIERLEQFLEGSEAASQGKAPLTAVVRNSYSMDGRVRKALDECRKVSAPRPGAAPAAASRGKVAA